jgi:hypothetical protein
MMSMMQKIATIVAVLGNINILDKVPLRFQINCSYGRVLCISKYIIVHCTVLLVFYTGIKSCQIRTPICFCSLDFHGLPLHWNIWKVTFPLFDGKTSYSRYCTYPTAIEILRHRERLYSVHRGKSRFLPQFSILHHPTDS